MATAGHTKVFNGDFSIDWSFDVLKTSGTRGKGVAARRETLLSAADTTVDELAKWLERGDSPAARAVCYVFFTLGSFYLAGHVLMALFN